MIPIGAQQNQQNLDQLKEEEQKSLKPLTKQQYSKLHSLATSLYTKEQKIKDLERFKEKNILVLRQNPETINILQEELQMTPNVFLKYMKIIGCRIRSFEKPSDQQQKNTTHLIYIKPPQMQESQAVKIQEIKFEEEEGIKQVPNSYGEISLQLSLRKAELQEKIMHEQQKELKDGAILALQKNIQQANLISQYAIFSILETAMREKSKTYLNEEKILDSIVHVKDRMDQCEGILRQCLEALGETQPTKLAPQVQIKAERSQQSIE